MNKLLYILSSIFLLLPPCRADSPLTWQELSAHAALIGFRERKHNEFKIDMFKETPSHVAVMRASIPLTMPEWEMLLMRGNRHILSNWRRFPLGNLIWDTTVDYVWRADPPNVDVSHLTRTDRYVVLYQDDPPTTRLYILSPNKSGEGGTLYYFYYFGEKLPSKDK